MAEGRKAKGRGLVAILPGKHKQGGQLVPLLYSTVAAQIVWSGAKVHSEVQVKMLVLAMMQCRTVLGDWCHPV